MGIERSITIVKREPEKDGDPAVFELVNPVRLLAPGDSAIMIFNAMGYYIADLHNCGKVGKRPNFKKPDYGVVRKITCVKVEPVIEGGDATYLTRDVENLDYLPEALMMLYNGMAQFLQQIAHREAAAVAAQMQLRQTQQGHGLVDARGRRLH